MDASISPAFWIDVQDQPPEVKLTALWAITHSGRDYCGVFRFSPRQLAFDTGLEGSWLERTIAALPGLFQRFGQDVLAVNFIRERLGSGEQLARSNVAKALRKPFARACPQTQKAILALYPELRPVLGDLQTASPSEALPKGLQPGMAVNPDDALDPNPEGLRKPFGSPYESLEGQDQLNSTQLRSDPEAGMGGTAGGQGALTPALSRPTGEGESSPAAGSAHAPGVGDPTEAEVIAAGSMRGLTEKQCREFFRHYAGLAWEYRGSRIVNWGHWLDRWRERDREYAQRNPAANGEATEALTAELERATAAGDGAEILRLQKKRRALEAKVQTPGPLRGATGGPK